MARFPFSRFFFFSFPRRFLIFPSSPIVSFPFFFNSLSFPFSLAHVAVSCAYQTIPWPSPLATPQALVEALFWAPTPQIVTSNHCPASPFFPSALTDGDQSFTCSFCTFSRCSLIALCLSLSLPPPLLPEGRVDALWKQTNRPTKMPATN